MKISIAIILLLVSCAPAVVAPRFEPVAGDALNQSQEFTEILEHYKITLTNGKLYRYDGNDERAFLAAVDAFYLEKPGFCPVVDGYYVTPNGQHQLTLAAQKTNIRAFIYNLSNKPKFEYAVLEGSSLEPLPVTPCRPAAR
jgi:hypothetical protein